MNPSHGHVNAVPSRQMTAILEIAKELSPLLAFLGGGVGVKVLDKILSRRSEQFSEASQIRDELREQIDDFRNEVQRWKQEADDWRTRYWELSHTHLALDRELQSLKISFAALKAQVKP